MKTVYQANRDLSSSFGGIPFAPETTYYIGLSNNATVSELNFTEPTGGGYTRVALPNNADSFNAPSNKSVSTKISIEFPTSTDTWGTVYAIGIYDSALSNGKLLYYEELSIPREVPAGVTLKFAAGAITITEV